MSCAVYHDLGNGDLARLGLAAGFVIDVQSKALQVGAGRSVLLAEARVLAITISAMNATTPSMECLPKIPPASETGCRRPRAIGLRRGAGAATVGMFSDERTEYVTAGSSAGECAARLTSVRANRTRLTACGVLQ